MTHTKSSLSAIVLMIQSCAAFAVMAACVKWASRSLPGLEIVFFRSLIGTAMILPLLIRKKISLLGNEKGLMVLRGLCGFAALSLYFYTISRIPLGTAVILNYTSPVFVFLIAIFFLKEKPSAVLAVLTGVCFYGIYLLAGSPMTSDDPAAILIGLLSAVFAAMAYTLIRTIKHRESPLTIIFYFTAISTAGSVFYLPFGFVWPQADTWLALAGVGIGSFYGQLWLTVSLQRAPASLIIPFSYFTPLFSFLLGILFFQEVMTGEILTGGAIIVLAGALISYLEAKRTKEGALS